MRRALVGRLCGGCRPACGRCLCRVRAPSASGLQPGDALGSISGGSARMPRASGRCQSPPTAWPARWVGFRQLGLPQPQWRPGRAGLGVGTGPVLHLKPEDAELVGGGGARLAPVTANARGSPFAAGCCRFRHAGALGRVSDLRRHTPAGHVLTGIRRRPRELCRGAGLWDGPTRLRVHLRVPWGRELCLLVVPGISHTCLKGPVDLSKATRGGAQRPRGRHPCPGSDPGGS